MDERRSSFQLYRTITEHIAAAIAAGAANFEMPWHRPALATPANAVTTRRYQGVNILSLWVAAQRRNYASGYWASYRQWRGVGAQVRKGEKATLVTFFREIDRSMAEGDRNDEPTGRRLLARASFVFNADQVDNWRIPAPEPERPPALVIDHAEQFVQGLGADIRAGGGSAFYVPQLDYIAMPDRRSFVGTHTSSATEGYYATLFHELVHWTGHESRLNREFEKRFGAEGYAVEELVAELGAAFLCADNGVANVPRPDHAAYVASWLRVLGNDPRAIVTAASKASAAVQFLNRRSAEANRRVGP